MSSRKTGARSLHHDKKRVSAERSSTPEREFRGFAVIVRSHLGSEPLWLSGDGSLTRFRVRARVFQGMEGFLFAEGVAKAINSSPDERYANLRRI
jgi:hypothetical protein